MLALAEKEDHVTNRCKADNDLRLLSAKENKLAEKYSNASSEYLRGIVTDVSYSDAAKHVAKLLLYARGEPLSSKNGAILLSVYWSSEEEYLAYE